MRKRRRVGRAASRRSAALGSRQPTAQLGAGATFQVGDRQTGAFEGHFEAVRRGQILLGSGQVLGQVQEVGQRRGGGFRAVVLADGAHEVPGQSPFGGDQPAYHRVIGSQDEAFGVYGGASGLFQPLQAGAVI